jgi:hypothetical protein
MAHFTRTREYSNSGINDVLHVPHGYRTARSAQIERKWVSTNKQGLNELPAGMFIAKTKDSNGNSTFRPLPHAKVTVAATTASPRFKVEMPYMFVPGDVLYIVAPTASITVASTALGTLTYNSQVYSYTPTGASTPAEAATKWAEYLNSTALANDFTFVADAANLHIFEANLNKTSTLTPTGGLGTTAATTAPNTTAIGTIASIDSTTEEIVLSANAAVALPVGFCIGARVDDIYGFYVHSIVFGAFSDGTLDIAVGHQGQLKKSRLPYWSNYIKTTYLPHVDAQDRY